jgi:hypothetical protein
MRVLRDLERRDGRVCAMTATTGDRLVPQHRAGGMGGRKNKHELPRLLWLDSIVNGWIESDPIWQATAKAWGVKISLHADPTKVPVFFQHEHAWFVLEGDGRKFVTATVALDMMLDVYDEDAYFAWKSIADDTAQSRALNLRGGR